MIALTPSLANKISKVSIISHKGVEPITSNEQEKGSNLMVGLPKKQCLSHPISLKEARSRKVLFSEAETYSFLKTYDKHKKRTDFPDEIEVGSEYYFEVEKHLKKKENPTARTIATVIDLGMKAAILYCMYSQIQKTGIPSEKDFLNKQTFLKTFAFTAYILAAQNLMEDAAKTLFGIEALRHGTSITNYAGIATKGGNPSKGGNSTGSSAGIEAEHFVESSKNYFHVFVDEYGYPDYYDLKAITELEKRLLPRMHAFLSGLQIGYDTTKVKNWLGGVASLLLSPNLRFFYHPESLPGQFVYDDDYDRKALKTPLLVNADHIGMRGIIGEALSNPEATKKTIAEELKDPREVAFIGACILGSLVFAKLAQNNLDCILKSDALKAIPEMTKNVLKENPNFLEALESGGINCTKAVFNMIVNLTKSLVLPTLYYSINIAK